jgi:acetyltransferase
VSPEPPSTFQLEDGRLVQVRPIQPEDAPLIQALVGRLSPESSYLRFHEYLQRLSEKQLYDFTQLDYDTRMAYVAALPGQDGDQIIAVARYAALPPGPLPDPKKAEVAIVVEDAFQMQGLGFYLLKRLTLYAREHEFQTFIGTIHPTNQRILEIIQETGLRFSRHFTDGVWEVEIDLSR